MSSKLASAIADVWNDVDRAFADLTEADALTQHGGGSSFAWTLLHIAGYEDGNINVRTRGRDRHPVLLDQFNRFRETPGAADNWDAIQQGVADLRAELQSWLESLSEEEMASMMVPATTRQPEQPLTYVLWRDIAHAYYHIGEVAAKRDQMGQRTGDYPSQWQRAL
jgi:uncharacterized damage-inducible protein DinB